LKVAYFSGGCEFYVGCMSFTSVCWYVGGIVS